METLQGLVSKAALFHQLHEPGKFLVLPNAWDRISASLVEQAGFPAIATASASMAFSEGYADGEQLPFERVLQRISDITAHTSLPVTVDLESGYADNPESLANNIEKLLDLGIAGINLEDTDRRSNTLYSTESQTARINKIRMVADNKGIPLFINARTDLVFRERYLTANALFEELFNKAKAYTAAGANGFFPIGLTDINVIRRLAKAIKVPLNILAFPGVPPLHELQSAGVRRVSTGPGLMKVAIHALQQALVHVKSDEGFDTISNIDVNLHALFSRMNKT